MLTLYSQASKTFITSQTHQSAGSLLLCL